MKGFRDFEATTMNSKELLQVVTAKCKVLKAASNILQRLNENLIDGVIIHNRKQANK